MTVYDLIEEYDDLTVTSHGYCELHSPFELSPYDYLKFAEQDAKRLANTHHAVNAIGNVKRALDCRVDTLLDFWGIKQKLWFPDKVKLVKQVGIVTPRLLTRINSYRNKIEHNYQRPNSESVQDYLDSVLLFVNYTDRYLKLNFDSELGCDERIDAPPGTKWSIDGRMDKMVAWFKLDRKKGVITIDGVDNREGKPAFKIRLAADTALDQYLFALNTWYKLID